MKKADTNTHTISRNNVIWLTFDTKMPTVGSENS